MTTISCRYCSLGAPQIRDEFHDTWVLSGTAAIPALGEAVFLRLGAKHWPKGGGPAPDNHVTFRDFKLEQW